MSNDFTPVDLYRLSFPATMKVDYIRWVAWEAAQGKHPPRAPAGRQPVLQPATMPPPHQAVPGPHRHQRGVLAHGIPHPAVPGVQQGPVHSAQGGPGQDTRRMHEWGAGQSAGPEHRPAGCAAPLPGMSAASWPAARQGSSGGPAAVVSWGTGTLCTCETMVTEGSGGDAPLESGSCLFSLVCMCHPRWELHFRCCKQPHPGHA